MTSATGALAAFSDAEGDGPAYCSGRPVLDRL
jgi:hypothetical protein